MRLDEDRPLEPGTLYIVATPIGNLEDITFRALRVLRRCDAIFAEDTRSALRLLSAYGLPTGKRVVSCFDGNEAGRAEDILRALERSETVALISDAGLPGVSDPGARIIAKAIAGGAKIEVIPGVSACLTALVLSGLPTDQFRFHGFPPREEGARQSLFGGLRRDPATHIFYESPARTGRTLRDLADSFGESRPCAVARELTKLHEETVRGALGEVAARYENEAPRGEITIVVGGAEAATQSETLNVEQEIADRLARGDSAKDVAAAVALLSGLPRRQIYQLALTLAKHK